MEGLDGRIRFFIFKFEIRKIFYFDKIFYNYLLNNYLVNRFMRKLGVEGFGRRGGFII